MSKTINVLFTKHPKDFRLAYVAGQEAAIEEKQAKELIKAGVAIPSDNSSDLPDDIPGRKVLISAGLSLADVKEITDFTEIEGIGKPTADKIVKYLKSLK